jgi:uncharacterized protein with PIN domain
MTWALDAGAIICWLRDEQGADRMEEVLKSEQPSIVHGVNLVEVQYILRRVGDEVARNAMERLWDAGVQIARDMDDRLLATAAQLKAEFPPIALGDVFAVALAVQRNAPLMTTDRGELEKVAAAGVCSIEFLR